MNTVKCSNPTCNESFQTEEAVADKATYLCRYHTGKDSRNTVRFQMHSFDKKLGGRKPVGTKHIAYIGLEEKLAREVKERGKI